MAPRRDDHHSPSIEELEDTNSLIRIAVLSQQNGQIVKQLDYISDEIKAMREQGVSKAEFCLVRNIVFGMVALIMVAVIGALVNLVVRGGA